MNGRRRAAKALRARRDERCVKPFVPRSEHREVLSSRRCRRSRARRGRAARRTRLRRSRSGRPAPCSSRPTIRPATRSSPTTAPPDGSLKQAGSYRTGGLGGVLDGSVVDHLASQGSLQLDREHGLLYAVNAGSDTITVFGVDGDRARPPPGPALVRPFPGQHRRPRQPRLRPQRPRRRVRSGLRAHRRLPRPDPGPGTAPSASIRRRRPSSPTRPARSRSPPTATTCSSPPRPTPTPSRCSTSTGSAASRRAPTTTVLAGCGAVRGRVRRVAGTWRSPRPDRTRSRRSGSTAAARCAPIAQAGTGQAATCWIVNVGGRLYLSNRRQRHGLGVRRRAATGRA